MGKYLLGIDLGTSACKIAVFSREGEIIATAAKDYRVYYPREHWAEQNPDEWWIAICEGIKEALLHAKINAKEIAGIGVDGQSWSSVAIDKTGNVLVNTPIWMDTRASKICDRLNKQIGSEKIFKVSGNSLQPSYTTAKIIWYKENLPHMYKNIDKILQSNSFIVFRLTGICSQEKSQGYGLHCFGNKEGVWDDDMCRLLGIERQMLPDIYECHHVVGTLTKEAAEQTGLFSGTPVVAGGLDAACGTLGAGVIHDGETQEQGGQAGGMSICMDTYHADPRLILSCHVVEGKWLLQGGTTGGGGIMRWLEREFGAYEREIGKEQHKSSLELFNEAAEKIAPASDGVVFLPYMSGERSPIWDIHAKGVYYGLDFSKTKAHMIRAAMEGVAYALKHNLEVAKEAGAKVDVLRAMGGSANSLLWTQIKADITKKPIAVPAADTATTLGAAILAGVGTGVYKDFQEAVDLTVHIKREHAPNLEHEQQYDKNYKIYRELYDNLKGIMKENQNA
ncbi:xylulokinase [Lachnospiraceae bacterium ZAX-1]